MIDWTQIIVALIAGLPGLIAALASLHIRQAIKTPSKRRIGAQVEDAVHIGLTNAYRLESVRKNAGAPASAAANVQAAKVDELVETP